MVPTEKLEKDGRTNPEECVMVFLDVDPVPDEFWKLQERLYDELDKSDAGEFDGNEVGIGSATLFAYGPDAGRLFKLMEPILKEYPFCRDARVVLRKGGPGSPQTEVRL
jgi:hypothetical protein